MTEMQSSDELQKEIAEQLGRKEQLEEEIRVHAAEVEKYNTELRIRVQQLQEIEENIKLELQKLLSGHQETTASGVSAALGAAAASSGGSAALGAAAASSGVADPTRKRKRTDPEDGNDPKKPRTVILEENVEGGEGKVGKSKPGEESGKISWKRGEAETELISYVRKHIADPEYQACFATYSNLVKQVPTGAAKKTLAALLAYTMLFDHASGTRRTIDKDHKSNRLSVQDLVELKIIPASWKDSIARVEGKHGSYQNKLKPSKATQARAKNVRTTIQQLAHEVEFTAARSVPLRAIYDECLTLSNRDEPRTWIQTKFPEDQRRQFRILYTLAAMRMYSKDGVPEQNRRSTIASTHAARFEGAVPNWLLEGSVAQRKSLSEEDKSYVLALFRALEPVQPNVQRGAG